MKRVSSLQKYYCLRCRRRWSFVLTLYGSFIKYAKLNLPSEGRKTDSTYKTARFPRLNSRNSGNQKSGINQGFAACVY